MLCVAFIGLFRVRDQGQPNSRYRVTLKLNLFRQFSSCFPSTSRQIQVLIKIGHECLVPHSSWPRTLCNIHRQVNQECKIHRIFPTVVCNISPFICVLKVNCETCLCTLKLKCNLLHWKIQMKHRSLCLDVPYILWSCCVKDVYSI
jgi:hypothetical protein